MTKIIVWTGIVLAAIVTLSAYLFGDEQVSDRAASFGASLLFIAFIVFLFLDGD